MLNGVCWPTWVIPGFRRLKQEDQEFEASMNYIPGLGLKE